MRLLFELDKKNYDPQGSVFRRPSVRGILLRDGKILMAHSLKYRYYKLPGGGIEPGESHETALMREIHEETGLRILAESIREYGLVRRITRGNVEDIFVQENFYYFCEPESLAADAQCLDGYEAEEGFTPEWIAAGDAVAANEKAIPEVGDMLERENCLLQMLMSEHPELFTTN